MPNFTLKLGDLDISAYVRVSEDSAAGLFDQDFLEPSFADSPLAEGGVLSVVDVGLHEKSVPLYLHDDTPALLRTLVRDLNRELRKPGLVRVEWKPPPGSGESTFYDLAFGRWESQHSMRHEAKGWLAGVLRLFVQPFGHTATERIIATAAGTGALLTVSIPSALSGDVDALLTAKITVGSQVRPRGHLVALAVLPHPSYVVHIPAGSLILENDATLLAASGAQGSQVVGAFLLTQQYGVGQRIARAALSPASVYEGRHRVLGIVQSRVQAGVELVAVEEGQSIGATALATAAGGYGLVDLGVFSGGKTARATISLEVHGRPRTAIDPNRRSLRQGTTNPAEAPAAHHALIINGLAVLPENRTTFLLDRGDTQLAWDSFTAPSGALDQTDDGITWAPTYVGTGIASPLHQTAATGTIDGRAVGGDGFRGNRLTTGEFRDGFMFAHVVFANLASQVAMLRKLGESQARYYTDARLGALANGTMYLAIVKVASGVESVLASARIASSGNILTGRLDFGFANSAATAVWRPHPNPAPTGLTVDTAVSASDANLSLPGEGALVVFASQTIASAPQPHIYDLTVLGSDPTTVLPKAIFRVDETSEQAWRASPSDVFAQALDGLRHRGAVPQLSAPSTPAVAVIALAHPAGPTNDLLSVEIRARERYEFSNI